MNVPDKSSDLQLERRDSDSADNSRGQKPIRRNSTTFVVCCELLVCGLLVGLFAVLPILFKVALLVLTIYGYKRHFALLDLPTNAKWGLYQFLWLGVVVGLIFFVAFAAERTGKAPPIGSSIVIVGGLLFPIPTLSFAYDVRCRNQLSTLLYIARSAIEIVVVLPVWAYLWAFLLIASGVVPQH